MNDDALNDLFKLALNIEQKRVETATGDTPQDYLYNQAESVRRGKMQGYVYVTFRGKEYGPARETFGALDGDKNKSTVLVQIDNGKWYKLWYFDNTVR